MQGNDGGLGSSTGKDDGVASRRLLALKKIDNCCQRYAMLRCARSSWLLWYCHSLLETSNLTSSLILPHLTVDTMAPTKKEGRKQRSALQDVVTRE